MTAVDLIDFDHMTLLDSCSHTSLYWPVLTCGCTMCWVVINRFLTFTHFYGITEHI